MIALARDIGLKGEWDGDNLDHRDHSRGTRIARVLRARTLPQVGFQSTGTARTARRVSEMFSRVGRSELGGFWILVDADLLNPLVKPAVGSPEPGGPGIEELAALLAPLMHHAAGSRAGGSAPHRAARPPIGRNHLTHVRLGDVGSRPIRCVTRSRPRLDCGEWHRRHGPTSRPDAPELASIGRRLISGRGGEALLSTVRGDDLPRIHPVNVDVADGRLYAFVIGRSPKRIDLETDGRYALHTHVDQAAPDEFSVRGRASLVTDDEVRARVGSGWAFEVDESYALFELSVASALVGARAADEWPPRYISWHAA